MMKSDDVHVASSSKTYTPLVAKLTGPDGSLTNNQVDSPSAPRNRGRSRTFSQVPLPFRPNNIGEELSTSGNKKGPSKALEESRKLLSHILNELANRPRAPSIWAEFKVGSIDGGEGGVVSLPGILKLGSDKTLKTKEMAMRTLSLPDSDDEEDALFSPDVTYDLLGRLRDVLLIVHTHSWQIFDSRVDEEDNDMTSSHFGQISSFRFRRSSFQRSGRRSRSFSPGHRRGTQSELLSQCISTLSSLISDDCRFQLQSRRPTRPPNALQALTLDIVRVLAHLHIGSSKVLYEIGIILVPAFFTFPVSMHGRLLNFFESVIMRPVLDTLKLVQKGRKDNTRTHEDPDLSEPAIEASVAIHVDEPLDNSFASSHSSLDWLRWTTSGTETGNTISTNTPGQSLDIYHLASLSTPLLAAILENVDIEALDPDLNSRVHRLIRLMVSYKPDAPLDVLDVIAYSTRRSRHRAISLFQTLWPRALGHVTTSKPFPALAYHHQIRRASQRRKNRLTPLHNHQFVPWRFQPTPSSIIFEGSVLHDCHICRKQISGFGILCPLCMCAVHPNCYDSPEGSYLAQFSVQNEQNTQKVALFRYSFITPQALDHDPNLFEVGSHTFENITIFTLSLCAICHLPLWGYLAQGYKCGTCNRFAHELCLQGGCAGQLPHCSVSSDTSAITIDWSVMRSSFAEYFHDILFREEDIVKHTHEELAVYWSVLWVQLEILKLGVASGSIIVSQIKPTTAGAKEGGVDDFELQYLVKMYEVYLASGRLRVSPLFEDWLQRNQLPGQFQNMLFDWASLTFITSIVKSPASGPDSDNDFLNVSTRDPYSTPGDLASHPFEVASIAHVRDILGEEFGLIHDQAACIVLSQLHHMGFFDCPQLPSGFFRTCSKPDEMECFFRIPLGLDLSSSVESLIIAIEVCLKDLDVSVNEIGFLLLVRRLWPNGMMSDYALDRLMRALLDWILSEDDKLVVIMREYVARRKNLPGVPSASESARWPTGAPSRSLSSGSNNNGNDYVACRQALLFKYASRWLFALHCLDHEAYGDMLFNVITGLAKDVKDVNDLDCDGKHPTATAIDPLWTDQVLRYILKISNTSIAFSATDDLIVKWLAVLPGSITHQHKSLPTLARLFNRDPEGSARWTVAHDATIASFEQIGATVMDPWRAVINVASESYDGLNKSLSWITLFATSGVDIPVNTFLQLSAMLRDFKASFDDHLALANAALAATWLKSMGRQDLQKMIADFHDRNAAYIIEHAASASKTKIYHFVRVTLATCLLLYGVNRNHLREIGFIEEKDIESLPSRRKVARRASFTEDNLRIEIDFVDSLVRYVEEGPLNLRCLIAKFLTTLLAEAFPHLGQQEIERFIIENGYFLTRCAWKFYDMHTTEIHSFRTSFLLRILVMDPHSFDELLKVNLLSDVAWETRLAVASRLYQIVLDVTKPSFHVENYQWRSNVLPVFYRFFSCLWEDDQEDIRSMTDSWAQALQPAHLEAISLCFSEALTRAPVKERLKLVTFALRLRGYFPQWKIISWDAIIETLMDDDFLQHNSNEETLASAHLSMYGISSTVDAKASRVIDPDVTELQCSLVSLSLQMIAEGIAVDLFSFLKIKYHLVTLLGFEGGGLVPAPSGHTFHVQFGEINAINDYALPCLQGLMILMDAFRPFDISPSAITGVEDESVTKLLVGSLVIDVIFALFNKLEDLSSLPALHLKTILRLLIVIIYKHDLESVPLRHLREPLRRAVRKASDMLLIDLSYELRQLIVPIVQAYMKKWPLQAHTVLIHHTHNVMKLLAKMHVASDDILAGQALAFLDEGLAQYWSSGLFYQLSKTQELPESYFIVLRHMVARNARRYSSNGTSMREDILRDTFTQLMAHPGDPGQKFVIENLNAYVENVHHQGLSPEMLAYIGRYMVAVIRNSGDCLPEFFNPNPLLLSSATFIQHNKSQVRDFLPYVETTLRLAVLRFDVSAQTIVRLLHVTSTLHRRAEFAGNERATQLNVVVNVIVEVLCEAFRGKNRASATTITGIAESLISRSDSIHETGRLATDILNRLATDAFYFLHNSSPSEFHTQKELSAYLATAGLILRAIDDDVGFLSRQLNDYAYERNGRNAFSVREWNILTLRAIQSPTRRAVKHLFSYLSKFSHVYHLSLRMHAHSMGIPGDLEASDISYAFSAIKLWLLLARRCTGYRSSVRSQEGIEEQSSEDRNAFQVWNELWPPFENLITMSEMDPDEAETLPIASLVWSSVVDIFLFLRQMHSTISLDSSAHITTLNRLKALGRGEAFTNKLARAVNSMSEPAQGVSIDVMIAQFQKEMLATDKVRALELKREIGRVGPADKGRKETRIPTG